MSVNKTLKNIRLNMGLTQKQLSKHLNITQGAVSHWEKGISNPSVTLANKIVKLATKHGVNCTLELLRAK